MVKALLLTTLITTKISTAGKVLSGLLAGKTNSEIRIRNEVFLKTIFFKIQRSLSLGCYYARRHFRYQ